MPDATVWRHIEELAEPQGLKVLIERSCRQPSCLCAYASTAMIINATRTNPVTTLFMMLPLRGVTHDIGGDQAGQG